MNEVYVVYGYTMVYGAFRSKERAEKFCTDTLINVSLDKGLTRFDPKSHRTLWMGSIHVSEGTETLYAIQEPDDRIGSVYPSLTDAAADLYADYQVIIPLTKMEDDSWIAVVFNEAEDTKVVREIHPVPIED